MKRHFVGRVGVAVILIVSLILSGCSTDWIGEAEQIVTALIPAASNIVALVAALQGKSVSTTDMATIQNVGAQAGADLQLIESLIAAYEKADDAAKPGILNQIQSAIGAVEGNLQGLMPALHIKDAATQAKVTAVVGLVLAEVESLAAVVPLVQGQGRAAALRAHSVMVPLSANEFVKSYNATMTAKTGNAALDKAAAGLQIHLHGKVARVASAGVLK